MRTDDDEGRCGAPFCNTLAKRRNEERTEPASTGNSDGGGLSFLRGGYGARVPRVFVP